MWLLSGCCFLLRQELALILKIMEREVGHFVTKQSEIILAVGILKTKSLVESYLHSVMLTMQEGAFHE